MTDEYNILIEEIAKAFGSEADEIIARIICGESADAAIQSLFMD